MQKRVLRISMPALPRHGREAWINTSCVRFVVVILKLFKCKDLFHCNRWSRFVVIFRCLGLKVVDSVTILLQQIYWKKCAGYLWTVIHMLYRESCIFKDFNCRSSPERWLWFNTKFIVVCCQGLGLQHQQHMQCLLILPVFSQRSTSVHCNWFLVQQLPWKVNGVIGKRTFALFFVVFVELTWWSRKKQSVNFITFRLPVPLLSLNSLAGFWNSSFSS